MGKLDRRIVIERAVATTDDYGGEIMDWQPICSPWAELNYGKGEERRSAAQENASLTATFRVRVSAMTNGVTVEDRIRFDGAIWDIISNVAWHREGRDITATRPA